MKTVNVNIPKNPYQIHITKWDWEFAIKKLKKSLKEDRLFIITNHKIKKIYQNKINKALSPHFKLIWLSIPDGEKYKNLKTYESLLNRLAQKQATRDSALLALGGGVVGDITGFVAATYMRGINYFQMPTSLLAQVDSSVGGKTGLDLVSGKNLVGSFYQPKAVFIFTDFLKTLPKKEFKCGLAEVIKYGLILDNSFFEYLNKNSKKILNKNPQTLAHIIYRSCEIKSQIVKKDEKEAGIRAILNFGHTLGHAIEVLNKYKTIKHGEAIAMGMSFATKLSAEIGASTKNHVKEIETLFKKYGLPTQWPKFSKNSYKTALLRDKKMTTENCRFICLSKTGKGQITPLSINTVLKCL